MPAGIGEMELSPNLKDGCHGGARGALPACENPTPWLVAAVQDVATSMHIYSCIITGLISDISHKSSPRSASMSGSALSLAEAASLQSVGKLMGRRGRPHAAPIQPISVLGVGSVQVRRMARGSGGVSKPVFALKASGG